MHCSNNALRYRFFIKFFGVVILVVILKGKNKGLGFLQVLKPTLLAEWVGFEPTHALTRLTI